MSQVTLLLVTTVIASFLVSSGESCHPAAILMSAMGNKMPPMMGRRAASSFQSGGGQVKYDSHYKAFFNRLDTNKDGQLDYAEGLKYFWAVDKNHDGVLETKEFTKSKSF